MKNKFKQLIFFVFAIVAAVSLSVAEASEPVDEASMKVENSNGVIKVTIKKTN